MREGRCLDDEMHWEARGAWTEAEVMKVNNYRARHPVPTGDYQPWPVAIALLQQPFVPFASEEERTEYMAKLESQERRLKEIRQDDTSVRAGDAPFFDKLIHDTHVQAAKDGHRPAKEGDKSFDPELDRVVARARTPFVAWCKRQIVDGEDGIGWVIQMWTYLPSGDINIRQWVIYNGPQ